MNVEVGSGEEDVVWRSLGTAWITVAERYWEPGEGFWGDLTLARKRIVHFMPADLGRSPASTPCPGQGCESCRGPRPGTLFIADSLAKIVPGNHPQLPDL